MLDVLVLFGKMSWVTARTYMVLAKQAVDAVLLPNHSPSLRRSSAPHSRPWRCMRGRDISHDIVRPPTRGAFLGTERPPSLGDFAFR